MKRYCYAPIPFALLLFSLFIRNKPQSRRYHLPFQGLVIYIKFALFASQFLFIPGFTLFSRPQQKRRKCNSHSKAYPPFYHNCTSTTHIKSFPSQRRELKSGLHQARDFRKKYDVEEKKRLESNLHLLSYAELNEFQLRLMKKALDPLPFTSWKKKEPVSGQISETTQKDHHSNA
ncbi:hypothetical protein BDZ45DRAFT_354719 [Acephala macrosclerotiorum]|nr:hypothetical protein BDZ45DRAFT_354719 [Acephala macrosclerotiorum]